jgi:hypothetical protein
VTYFAKRFPSYPTPHLVRLVVTKTEVVSEEARVKKAKDKAAETEAKRAVLNKKRRVEEAMKALNEAEAALKKTKESVGSSITDSFPEFIALGVPNGTAVRRDNLKTALAGKKGASGDLSVEYYRPAGCWWADVFYNDKDELVAVVKGGGDAKQVPVFPTTPEHFRADNEGYL